MRSRDGALVQRMARNVGHCLGSVSVAEQNFRSAVALRNAVVRIPLVLFFRGADQRYNAPGPKIQFHFRNTFFV